MLDFLDKISDEQFWSVCMVLIPMSVLFAIYFLLDKESN